MISLKYRVVIARKSLYRFFGKAISIGKLKPSKDCFVPRNDGTHICGNFKKQFHFKNFYPKVPS